MIGDNSGVSHLRNRFEQKIEKEAKEAESLKPKPHSKTDKLSDPVKTGHGDAVEKAPPEPERPLSDVKAVPSETNTSPSKVTVTFKRVAPKNTAVTSKWGVKSKTESLTVQIDSLDSKNRLNQQMRIEAPRLRGVNQDKFDEEVFQCDKELYRLKEQLEPQTSPEIHKKLETMEKKLDQHAAHLPRVKDIVDTFGEEALDVSLKKTLNNILSHAEITPSELQNEARLLRKSDQQMAAEYANRMLKGASKFPLSTITRIEQEWKQFQKEGTNASVEKKIGDHYVTFVAGSGPFIKKGVLGAGTSKVAFSVDAYMHGGKVEGKKVVFLQLQEGLEDQIEELRNIQSKKNQSEGVLSLKEMKAKALHEQFGVPLPKMVGDESENSEKQTTSFNKSKVNEHNIPEPLDSEYGSTVVKQDKAKESNKHNIPDPDDSEYGSTVIKQDKAEESNKHNIPDPDDSEYGSIVNKQERTSNVTSSVKGKEMPSFFALYQQREKERALLEENSVEQASTEIHKENAEMQAMKEMQREIEMNLILSGKPGVIKTIGVTDGKNMGMLQFSAGYKIGKDLPRAYDLSEMALANELGLLNEEQQIQYLDAIGDFLDGVASLHEMKILHRDIKPQNVVIYKNGEGRLTDFGASAYKKSPALKELIGTPFYLSPEAVHLDSQGIGDQLTEKSDNFAVGISLWSMVSGMRAYRHPSIKSFNPDGSLEQLHEDVKKLAFYKPRQEGYKEENQEPKNEHSLAHLVWECTQAKPEDRPTSKEIREKYQIWRDETVAKLTTENKEDKISNIMENFGELPVGIRPAEFKSELSLL